MVSVASSVFQDLQSSHTFDSATLDLSQEDFEVFFAHCSYYIEGAKILADANRDIFGFITRGAFSDALQARTLIVVTQRERVIGFLRYHHRKRDRQTTLYDICVSEPARGKKLGQKMMALLLADCCLSNRATIVLKCPAHLAANTFYEKCGFRCIDTLIGKRQRLNVWQLDLTARSEQ